jgi:hypothetical protein
LFPDDLFPGLYIIASDTASITVEGNFIKETDEEYFENGSWVHQVLEVSKLGASTKMSGFI